LLLSKAHHDLKMHHQQQLQISFGQETNLCFENETKNEETSNQMNKDKSLKQNVFANQFQQSIIDSLQQQLDAMEHSYNELLIAHNMRAVELEECKRNLKLKVN
jgi:hypothetical protein